MPDGWTTALVVLRGALRVNGSEAIGAAEVALFDRAGARIRIDGAKDATALLLSGEPIDEPIVGSGPFVMNSAREIRQAIVGLPERPDGAPRLRHTSNRLDAWAFGWAARPATIA